MLNKIKDILNEVTSTDKGDKNIKTLKMDEETLEEVMALLAAQQTEPDMRTIGLFTDVAEEKIAELAHAMLYLQELNRLDTTGKNQKPIEFYISTYGGSADDMFALYDIMRQIKKTTEIHTIGMGKVMSAGVLLLAAGTKGQRKIGQNCRVMIHSVIGGNHGPLHNLMNEMEAIEQIQKMYSQALIAETNMSKSDLKDLLERKVNVYLTAEEAVELGIADIII